MCICMHLFLVLALQANSFLFHIVCTRKIVCLPPSVPPPQKKCGAMRRLCRVTSEGGMQARPAGREDHSNGWLLLSSYLSVGTTLSPLYAHTHTLLLCCAIALVHVGPHSILPDRAWATDGGSSADH